MMCEVSHKEVLVHSDSIRQLCKTVCTTPILRYSYRCIDCYEMGLDLGNKINENDYPRPLEQSPRDQCRCS
jgi:hypothetical protein